MGPPGPGWLPARVRAESGEPLLDWAYFGDRRLTEPFYEESVARARAASPALITTRLADLTHWRGPASLQPTGLIFHMSRCGSTLVSQVLSASSENVVISEAPALDSLLRGGGTQVAAEQRVAWIRWIVSALAQQRTGQETRCFIKLDCWHVPYLPLLRKALPEVPDRKSVV